jgi:hypothetical protein
LSVAALVRCDALFCSRQADVLTEISETDPNYILGSDFQTEFDRYVESCELSAEVKELVSAILDICNLIKSAMANDTRLPFLFDASVASDKTAGESEKHDKRKDLLECIRYLSRYRLLVNVQEK